MKISNKILQFLISIVAIYLRNTPIEYGRWRLLNITRKLICSIYPVNKKHIINTRHDFKINVDLDDYVTQEIYLCGEYEQEVTLLLKKILNQGDIFIDVGANVGYFSLLASIIVGDTGKVYAFEPIFSDEIIQNLKLNEVSNCVVNTIALSNCSGEITMYKASPDNQGMSSFREINNGKKIDAKAQRFDDYLGGNISPKLIKVDVEGAEKLVLEGMENCLNAYHPDIIIEITDNFLKELGASGEELCQALIEKGYDMYLISGEKLQLFDIQDLLAMSDYQFNAYFTINK